MKFLYDFDNCIMKGDITEGFPNNYIGIPEYLYAIGKANTSIYKTFQDYNETYYLQEKKFNTDAYTFPLSITDENSSIYINEYWESTLKNYINQKVKKLIERQSKYGEIWIITASPTLFVKPIQKYIPEIVNVVGIDKDEIISYSQGKLSRILSILSPEQIGGFTGETWINDGPLLSYLRNYNKCNDKLRFINHGQIDKNTKKNLMLYNIRIINTDLY